ncbi:MAG: phenylphosphate carboxylase subunit gamma [Chloroflexi bacterium]|nr:phenylphosphate carboxylase subunit gamma [Chloroflexota bacterium]
MVKEYSTFVSAPQGLPEGQEIKLAIKDLTPGPRKYDCRIVKAIVASSSDRIEGGDVLWLKSLVGITSPKPWAIKILEELGDSIPRPPYSELIQVTEALNEGLTLE